MDEQLIRNGLGSETDQILGTKDQHRLWAQGWYALTIHLALRNPDGISANRYDFTHAASVELENNEHALACASCLTSTCTKLSHGKEWDADIEWSPINYVNVDHMEED